MSHATISLGRLFRKRSAAASSVILAMLALVAIFAEVLASSAPLVAVGPSRIALLPGVVHSTSYAKLRPSDVTALHAHDRVVWPVIRYGPDTLDDAGPLAPPSSHHVLGTDTHGRDLAARLIYGTRTALGLSLGAVLVALILGVPLGGLAGFGSGFWNDRLTRLVETVDTFPAVIVVALVRAIERQPSAISLMIAVALVRWAEVARLVRTEVLRAMAEDYGTAAHALGASPVRIFWRHFLPNVQGPALVSSVFGVGSIVLLEAVLSFLSMGAEASFASWGETLAEGARDPSQTRLLAFPAALLLATVSSTYLLGSAVRKATDPVTAGLREMPRAVLPKENRSAARP